MGYSDGALLAQNELQVLEHPPLSHVKTAMAQKGHAYMKKNEIYLIKNVERFGILDTQTPLANGRTLYGNQFAQASSANILSHLHVANSPQPSNIVFMAAPHIGNNLKGKPYQKNNMEQLFYTAFNAFWSSNYNSAPGSSCQIHTGNWGAGAFGNSAKVSHLLQIAAAHAAGVNAQFYPLDQAPAFHSAQLLFNEIMRQYPEMSVDQFLDHLAEHAQVYDLLYGHGNGT